MSKILTKEEVMHVAELARIKINEEEIEKFRVELGSLLEDVEKINDVVGYDDEIMIASWNQDTKLRDDEVGEMLSPKEVLENVPRHSGNYISVPVVIGEEV